MGDMSFIVNSKTTFCGGKFSSARTGQRLSTWCNTKYVAVVVVVVVVPKAAIMDQSG